MISRPATSRRRVRWGRENPSYTGHMWVTPSPLSITIPVSKPTGTDIYLIYLIRSLEGGGGLLFIKINLQTRLLIVTRLVNEA